jgi:hypothetical protein
MQLGTLDHDDAKHQPIIFQSKRLMSYHRSVIKPSWQDRDGTASFRISTNPLFFFFNCRGKKSMVIFF